MKEVSRLIVQKLKTMIDAADPDAIHSKRKAVTALFMYAARQERDGRRAMLHTFLQAARASATLWGFMWCRITPLITTLLDEGSPVSLRQAAVLALPYLPWRDLSSGDNEHLVQLWVVAAVTVPHTNEVVQSVADTLLQTSSNSSLRPHIPIETWSWLNECPSLPPICAGRFWGLSLSVVRMVRALGDAETLTSYLILVWAEWEYLDDESLSEMCTLIQEDLGGIWMGRYRVVLLRHLDHVLGQLDLGSEYLRQHDPRINEGDIRLRNGQYVELKEVLLEVERGAIDELIREFSGSVALFSQLIISSYAQAQGAVRHLCVRFLSSACSLVPGHSDPSTTPPANRL